MLETKSGKVQLRVNVTETKDKKIKVSIEEKLESFRDQSAAPRLEPANTTRINRVFEELFTQLHDSTSGGITVANFIMIVDCGMKIAGDLKDMTGEQKKALVIDVIDMGINRLPVNLLDKVALDLLVETMLPSFIDQLYQISPERYGKPKLKYLCFPWLR